MPSTSFSYARASSASYSPTFGYLSSNDCLSSSETRSNRLICPAIVDFLSCCTLSTIDAYTIAICFLVPSSESQAPAFIRFSIARLLISSFWQVLSIKSESVRNLPPLSLSSIIWSMTGLPSDLMAYMPYLTWSPSAVNSPCPQLISGGSTLIPISRQL